MDTYEVLNKIIEKLGLEFGGGLSPTENEEARWIIGQYGQKCFDDGMEHGFKLCREGGHSDDE